jgi:hypothetical protein
MENNNNIPRRKWLKLGFGIAAGTIGLHLPFQKLMK